MSEFCHGKELGPIFGFIRSEQSEVCLQFLVYPFGFSISLRVIGCGEGDVVLEEASEFSHKGRSKLWSSIGDYLRVKAKPRKNIGEEELGDSFGINVFCAGAVNYPLRKPMVYHDHDRIVSVGIGKSSDEIHRYGGKGEGVVNSQRGKSRYHGMCVYLGRLAISTS